ncbi:beta-ketoacyl synthase N-terminal-like domain-containing protein [Persicobacter psychrovividus]
MSNHKEKIAIIGMGGLFPGSDNLDQFWTNLMDNKDLVSKSGKEQFGAEPAKYYHDEKGKLDKCYSLRGGYVKDFQFDAEGFQLKADVLLQQDKQFQWSLFVAREALKHAGYWGKPMADCGVIMGNLSFPTQRSRQLLSEVYADMAQELITELTGHQVKVPPYQTNYSASLENTLLSNAPAALIAQAVGLKGTHYALDAACASSLYAVKLACDELLSGKSNMMLAGAVSGSDPLFIHMGFSYFHAYPRMHETSAPLQSASGGLTSAEGAGMVVLKRLSDAEAQGDQILAVIDAVGLSNDGKGKFLLSPNPRGQKLAFERAYAQTDVTPQQIDYLECHATGTPLGDKTEMNSISDFFGSNPPQIGSVKSNMGHLLTAAGMTGLMKVVLAMREKFIPATIKVDAPLQVDGCKVGGEQMVLENQAWNAKNGTPRAGINAFGFGGTNGHIILSAYEEEQEQQSTSSAEKTAEKYSPSPLAITGMDLHFGEVTNLEEFYFTLFEGKQHFRSLPPRRWKGLEQLPSVSRLFGLPEAEKIQGNWLESFDLNLRRFKIQPKEAQRLTFQQTLMLKVADQALKDAQMEGLEGKGANVAVLMAMESELEIHHRMGRWDLSWQVTQALEQAGLSMEDAKESSLTGILRNAIFPAFDDHSPSEHTGFIGNIISSRISALWDFTGPSFTISSNENAVYKALEVGQNLLATGEVDAVVLGAIDLAGSLEGVATRHHLHPMNDGTASCSWSKDTSGWLVGEGAGAIVLKRKSDITNERVYAYMDGLAIVQSQKTDLRGAVDSETIKSAAQQAMKQAKVTAKEVGLIEVAANGVAHDDAAEMEALSALFPKMPPLAEGMPAYPTTAIGTAKAHIGHTFSASGIASIIKTALSLYHRFVPAIPQWSAPKTETQLSDSAFYFPTVSTPWFPEVYAQRLVAGVQGISSDGTAAHLILSEGSHPTSSKGSAYLKKGGARLFPFSAPTVEALQAEIFAQEASSADFTDLSDRLCEAFSTSKSVAVAVIVAANPKELKRELALFGKNLLSCAKAGKTLQTPSGSYFTPNPLGEEGKIAWMYPGAGSAYIGLGTALFQAFPDLYDVIRSRVNHMQSAIFAPEIYPRNLHALNEEEQRQQLRRLRSMALPMMSAGCTYSAMLTHIYQEKLGVPGDAVLGYSMGETSSMMYAQNVWSAKYIDQKFLTSNLFSEKVGGRLTLLAEHWGVTPKEARGRWTSYLLNVRGGMSGYNTLADWCTAELLPLHEEVFLSFINTDEEIIISGDRTALLQALEKFGLQGMEIRNNNIVHHDFCRRETEAFIEMHMLPIASKPPLAFYSGVTGKPLPLEQQALAENAMEVCCQKVNWPMLTRSLHADGHRLFVEVGANATLSRWTDINLKDKPHVCIPSDRKGVSALKNLCATTAMMMAHGVAVNLTDFYTPEAEKPQEKILNISLKTGGEPYREFALTATHRALFQTGITKTAVASTKNGHKSHSEMLQQPAAPLQQTAQAATTENTATSFGGAAQKLNITDNNHMNTTTFSVEAQLGENGLKLQDYNDPMYLNGKKVIWDEKDLETFATGKIADVFGEEFSVIDSYKRRVMLPMHPYLLVSRVTDLNAKTHEYKPSTVTTEYDIPYGSKFTTDQQIPWAVAVESGQCDLLLISYLGIDFENKGEYVYRLLDCTLTFMDDLPYEGQTLRYDISINNYVRNGKNLLFFFSYKCYVEDRLVLKMDGGCAGFFSDAELAEGQGVVFSPSELADRAGRKKQFFTPLLACDKTTFNKEELRNMVAGDFVSCFNENYISNGKNKSLRLPPEEILMLDRITKVERTGGTSGLGYIEAVKDLKADDWYFPCHFRDDEVLAGSLQAEGGGQLLRFFMMYLGMQRLTKDARFQPVLGVPQKVRCRKEVPAKDGQLIYKMDVKEIGLTPEPYVIADLEIHYDGYIAVFFENLGLKLQEKDNPNYLKSTKNLVNGIEVKPTEQPVLFNESQITQFALGKVSDCFGPEYDVYEGRCLSRQPNTDLQFISRVLSVDGERHTFNNSPVITSEYDVPADAWYYQQNASPEMPYSVLMEVALQPCGFLGAYLGSTLAFPDKDLFFRNLDGDGEMVKWVDLRGKTVTNKSCLYSHTNLAGTVLQRYRFELFVDGELFYKGTSSFGFFTKDDLASQAGLDQGKIVKPWKDEAKAGGMSIDLSSPFAQKKLFSPIFSASPQLHLSGQQLKLIDRATVIKDGGKHGQGYVLASKEVKAHEWFFTCHFYQDSVMPGSLGVEAMYQAIQLYAVQQGLGKNLQNATIQHVGGAHKTVWKYRGQILQTDHEMNLEVHIKEVRTEGNQVVIVADASLWKGELRIYEVENLGVELRGA